MKKKLIWFGDWAIPKRINLPGLRVRIKIVPQDEVEVLNGCDGLWLYDHGKGSAVMMIDGSLSLPVQRYVVCHELQHIMTDLLDIMVEKFSGQVHPKSFETQVTQIAHLTALGPEQLDTQKLVPLAESAEK